MILDGHVYSHIWILASTGWYDDLHPTYQQLVTEAGFWASIDARKVNRVANELGVQFLQNRGIEVSDPPADLRQEFRDATKESVREVIRNQMDNPGKLEEMNTAIETAREELGYNKYTS